MLQQSGVVKPIADCNFNIIDFMAAVTEARLAQEKADEAKAAEAEPDPTQPPSSPTDSAVSPESSTPPATAPWSSQQQQGQPIAS